LSAKTHADALTAIVATIPEAILAAELTRRAEAEHRLDRSEQTATQPRIKELERRAALTVDQFCLRYNISRSSLYEQWRGGVGPRLFRVGTAKRISVTSAEDWVREREAATVQTAPVNNEAA
jgi:DNA-binding transcriptional regulator YiaG